MQTLSNPNGQKRWKIALRYLVVAALLIIGLFLADFFWGVGSYLNLYQPIEIKVVLFIVAFVAVSIVIDILKYALQKIGVQNLNSKIIYTVVLSVILISVYSLWYMDKSLNENFESCSGEIYPLEECGGIAERDVKNNVYLKIIMLSVLAFGSTALMLSATKLDKKES